MIEQHYTAAELAVKFNCSEETILRACREGRMRSFVIPGGRARRIAESDAEEWRKSGLSPKVSGSVMELRRAG